jgi:8-amino-7-oxononanoate synthase
MICGGPSSNLPPRMRADDRDRSSDWAAQGGADRVAPVGLLDATESLDHVLARELEMMTRAGLRRSLRPLHHRAGSRVVDDSRTAIDFSSNDYLGLASDPRIAAAAAAALATDAIGAGAARLISGNHPWHETLEQDLARFKHVDAVLLFGSGYLANIGTVPALVGRGDVIYADALNHASLIDACRLSRAEVRIVPHADPDALAHTMSEDRGNFRRRLVVLDAVFSMDGDRAPLDRIVAVARHEGAWTYLDDAHGTAVLGANGRGSAEHWDVEDGVDIVMGTLGKALGVAGAFVAGSRTLIEYLVNRARAFVFTTGMPPALAAASVTALRIARAEPERRDRVRTVARRLRNGLALLGHTAPGDADGHIIPVMVGDAGATVRLGAALREQGFLVGAVRPPTVPVATSRLRITASAAHSDADVAALLDALEVVLPRAD